MMPAPPETDPYISQQYYKDSFTRLFALPDAPPSLSKQTRTLRIAMPQTTDQATAPTLNARQARLSALQHAIQALTYDEMTNFAANLASCFAADDTRIDNIIDIADALTHLADCIETGEYE